MDDSRIYKAVVKRVYDAETIVINIDLGFGSWLHHFKVKLAGIEAKDKRGGNLENAVNWLSDKILYREIVIMSVKGAGPRQGKYEVYIFKTYSDTFSSKSKYGEIVEGLVENGYATYKPVKKKKEKSII